MNIIFLSSKKGKLFTLGLGRALHLSLILLVTVAVIGGSMFLGYSMNGNPRYESLLAGWEDDLHQQKVKLGQIRQEADANVNALSSRIGLLQAHVMRIDALGQKLIKMAKIDRSEFDFGNPPAIGGPESTTQSSAQSMLQSHDLHIAIKELNRVIESRENQLIVLEDLLMSRNLLNDVQPSGRPIKRGWLSSYFGMRLHPISGNNEMHKGIDFAGKYGDTVIAVAKGVVTYAGKKSNYGQVIDIAHGNNYTTRYAHNSKLMVSVGDTVEKGFKIAEIGTSGRSTGPHVHFEVLKNGKQINPKQFIHASN